MTRFPKKFSLLFISFTMSFQLDAFTAKITVKEAENRSKHLRGREDPDLDDIAYVRAVRILPDLRIERFC
ncbi:hypothetical protein Hypma_002757 [Hypsizygus marmoreus]|uniref:Uncharacterized protein n=1 Tax=Hypsizygus marmoreus TaxID=39966 RepID=A0A369JAF5_HYPMA|nr:hypothetical protein Hypma_002757 [Hypsizygus marmoreus]